jgi:hypothetical protein
MLAFQELIVGLPRISIEKKNSFNKPKKLGKSKTIF